MHIWPFKCLIMMILTAKYHENLLRDSTSSLPSIENKMILKTPNEPFLRIARYQMKPWKESSDTCHVNGENGKKTSERLSRGNSFAEYFSDQQNFRWFWLKFVPCMELPTIAKNLIKQNSRLCVKEVICGEFLKFY